MLPVALHSGGSPISSGACRAFARDAAIRTVIAEAIIEHGESSGRGFDALFAMRQAEAIVKALAIAGYAIKRQS